DRKDRDDNKRTNNRREFATVTNPIRKEYTGTAPKCPNCSFHHILETPCRKCTNCNRLGNFAKDCRAGPRIVTPVNARNSTSARGACFECGGTDHYKASCTRLNRAPSKESLPGPEFDSSADYSFVVTPRHRRKHGNAT
ncbi:putative reverse transcriptase domain-containing protein, partial [Tanacetum coccineum]